MKLEEEKTWDAIKKMRHGMAVRWPSKIFTDLIYWNTTQDEISFDFPTLYWKVKK